MSANYFNVTVLDKPDGSISRLGLGHAWKWTRASGAVETFDCGLYIGEVLGYAAKRAGVGPRDVNFSQT